MKNFLLNGFWYSVIWVKELILSILRIFVYVGYILLGIIAASMGGFFMLTSLILLCILNFDFKWKKKS